MLRGEVAENDDVDVSPLFPAPLLSGPCAEEIYAGAR